jgi:Protein of unknown function (DUF1444)
MKNLRKILLFVAIIIGVLVACLWLQSKSYSHRVSAPYFSPLRWKSEIGQPNLTEHQFVTLYAQLLAARNPQADVEIVGELEVSVKFPDGSSTLSFLDNAWRECQQHPESRAEICERYMEIAKKSVINEKQEDKDYSTNCLIPVIKDDRFLHEIAKQSGSKFKPTAERLAADLWILYVFDADGRMVFLTEEKREQLGLDLPKLRALSMENLRRITPELERHGTNDLYMLVLDGNYEASLLLSDKLWDSQSSVIKGDLVAVVPSRDVLLFSGTGSPAALQSTKKKAQQIDETGNHLISTTLLIRHSNHWEKYSE